MVDEKENPELKERYAWLEGSKEDYDAQVNKLIREHEELRGMYELKKDSEKRAYGQVSKLRKLISESLGKIMNYVMEYSGKDGLILLNGEGEIIAKNSYAEKLFPEINLEKEDLLKLCTNEPEAKYLGKLIFEPPKEHPMNEEDENDEVDEGREAVFYRGEGKKTTALIVRLIDYKDYEEPEDGSNVYSRIYTLLSVRKPSGMFSGDKKLVERLAKQISGNGDEEDSEIKGNSEDVSGELEKKLDEEKEAI